MKKLLQISFLLAAFVIAKPVSADNYYAGFGGGSAWARFHASGFKFKYKPSFYGIIDAGYRWCNGVRVEGEFSYRHSRLHDVVLKFVRRRTHLKGQINQYAGLANFIYELYNPTGFVPFAGVGVGVAAQKVSLHGAHKYHHLKRHGVGGFHKDRLYFEKIVRGFAYQLIGGVKIRVAARTELAIQMRYFHGKEQNLNTYSGCVSMNYNL